MHGTCGLVIVAIGVLESWLRGSLVVPRRTRNARYISGGIMGLVLSVFVFPVLLMAIDLVVSFPSLRGISKMFGHSLVIALALSFFILVSAASLFSGIYIMYVVLKSSGQMRMDRLVMCVSTAIFTFVIFFIPRCCTLAVSLLRFTRPFRRLWAEVDRRA